MADIYPPDLTTELGQLRQAVGDTELPYLLGDQVYEMLALQYPDSVDSRIIPALRLIVFQTAKYMNEETGDVRVWWQQIHDNYSKLYDKALQDPEIAGTVKLVTPYVGGTVRSEVDRVRNDPESVGGGYSIGDSRGCNWNTGFSSTGFRRFS